MDLIRSLNERRLPQDVQDVLETLKHLSFLLKLCLKNMSCDLVLLHLPLSFQQDVLLPQYIVLDVFSKEVLLLAGHLPTLSYALQDHSYQRQ